MASHFIPRFSLRILTFFLPLLAAIPTWGSMTGKWLRHPSFYSQTEKIIDGERATYFLLHQQRYGTWTDYSLNTASLFLYDKENPGDGIRPLAGLYEAFPTTIRTATYSPANKWLVAAADDGQIWIIPDGQAPFAIPGMEHIILPGNPRINSITENRADGKMWVAASYGYAIVDPLERAVERIVTTDFPIDWICRVGNHIVAFAESSVYVADAGSLPSRLDRFSRLSFQPSEANAHLLDNGHITCAVNLMPLTEHTFAFLGPRSTNALGNTIAVISFAGDGWHLLPLLEQETRMIAADKTFIHRTANNAYPNKEGFYVAAQNTVSQLVAGIDPDFSSPDPAADFKNRAVKTVYKADTWKESASWDLAGFWFFTERDGFYTRTLTGSSWSDPSDVIWPDAPTPFTASHMKWSPNYGLLVSNHGITNIFTSNVAVPWLLNAFRNGKWVQYSPVFFPPQEIAADEALAKTFKSYCENYPLANPDGLAFDPACPNLIYAGSLNSGWARIDLENISAFPLHVANVKNAFTAFPGFIDDTPVFAAWTTLSNFRAPEFDSYGNLWTLFQDMDKAKSDKYSVSLRYYTPDDLKAMANAVADPSAYRPMREITIHIDASPSPYQQFIPLKHEKNRNMIAFFPGNFSGPLHIYDHNGTLDDTSDDRLAVLDDLFDAQSGDAITKTYTYSLWEDPSTGDVWMGCRAGAFHVDPVSAFDNPTTAVRHRVKSHPDGAPDKKILEAIQANAFTTDDLNRLWIGTHNDGVMCLSPDRTEILGEFTVTNSGIPSNEVYSLCYNPERRSLMVSTRLGLAEFFPSDLGGDTSGSAITVAPANVGPSYLGWITVTGLADNTAVAVKNAAGVTVRLLGSPSGGMIQWDGNDASGRRVATGTYSVCDNDTGHTLTTVRIIN